MDVIFFEGGLGLAWAGLIWFASIYNVCWLGGREAKIAIRYPKEKVLVGLRMDGGITGRTFRKLKTCM